MMTDATMKDARRAALVVHAMPETDRAWLLQQLPASQRLVMQPLLQELQALGIPQAEGILEDFRDAADAGVAEREAQADALRCLLEAEPLRLTAAIASLRDWPPAAVFASKLDPQRRSAALLCEARVQQAPALRAALMQAVQQAMREVPPQRTPPKRAGWRRLIERLQQRVA